MMQVFSQLSVGDILKVGKDTTKFESSKLKRGKLVVHSS